jgi:predicted nucleic acid-binding protein
MRRIVVCDTGPLIHLGEANIISLLRLAGEILIPSVVAEEFKRNTSDFRLPDWVLLQELEEPYQKKVLAWRKQIDEGEAAAIALTMQMQAEWLLTDDAFARQFGESLGLEIHGSIGLLLWAVSVGHVKSENEAMNSFNALIGSSLWISDRVVKQVYGAIHALYSV